MHTFPSPTGDRKGIGHARGPDPFGMVRHSPSVFQFWQRETRRPQAPPMEAIGEVQDILPARLRIRAGFPPRSNAQTEIVLVVSKATIDVRARYRIER